MHFWTGVLFSTLLALPGMVSAALIPNADTPVFYLVGDDPFGDTYKPLRLTGQHLTATLTGEGPIAMLYFINGTLVAEDPIAGSTSPNLYHPYVDFAAHGDDPSQCSTSGPLMFVQDPHVDAIRNKTCTAFSDFFLFSDRMDNQLGAKLILNSNLTSFYACGNARDIVYKVNVTDDPVNCFTPVQLYTLPVV